MKLWILQPYNRGSGEFFPPYDKMHAVVIRAENEKRARLVAADAAHDEGPEVWLNASKTSCTVVDVDGTEEVIIAETT